MSADSDRRRQQIADAVLESYRLHGELAHLTEATFPNREAIWRVVEDLLRILFPGVLETGLPEGAEIENWTRDRLRSVERRLAAEIARGQALRPRPADGGDRETEAAGITMMLLESLPGIRDRLALDAGAAFAGDPAAESVTEVVVAYQGLQAIAVYRMAHVLHEAGARMVARVMSEYAHSRTGVDIHPGARIGSHFFIDHGTGVVIGETATIGDHVRIYQGVTLGAKSFVRDRAGRIIKGVKRHPDIEDHVTIYAGATILGDVRIGKGSVIGGNAWVTRSVSPNTRVIAKPPQEVHSDEALDDFQI